MKKFITVAALVAAGTAFANAAYTSSVYNGLGEGNLMAYWSFDDGVGVVSDFTAVSGVSAPTWSSASGTTESSGGVLGGGYASYVASNLTPYATLPLSGDPATNLGMSSLSFFIQLNENSSGTVFSVTNDSSKSVWVSGYTLNVGASSYDLSAVSRTSDWVNVTLTANWSEYSVFVNGDAAASSETATFDPGGQGLGVQFGAQYGSGGHGNLSSANLDEVALWTGVVLTEEQIKTYATLGVVPEPSAFGLLAGIGALAMVAARRRRSRR